MDGSSETVSPSKSSDHPPGAMGVTTSRPQPQQQRWIAVMNGIEMYNVPASGSPGTSSTNSKRRAELRTYGWSSLSMAFPSMV